MAPKPVKKLKGGKAPPPPPPVSQAEYARHRGVTQAAVKKAIDTGRLKNSVVKGDGGKKLLVLELADDEWDRNTQGAARLEIHLLEEEVPPLAVSLARREAARAALAEIELAEKQRELITVDEVESRLVNVFSQCRTKLLGVPSRARQQDPDLSPAQIALVEALIREALDDLATSSELDDEAA